MDNGTLVFIIIIMGVVIVWQASKLKQYHKFEQMMGDGMKSVQSPSGTSVASSEQPVPVKPPTSSAADAASRAVAASVSSLGDDDELLDMQGVDPESNIEDAKRVQLVMARCRYAEFYLEQLDDDYERGQFQKIINSCKTTARNIEDPFFRSSALQPVIVLLDQAEWTEERDELLSEVNDQLIRQRINEELTVESS